MVCAGLALAGCSATVDPDPFIAACVAGETTQCECDDGAPGAQTCRADGGGYGDCDCRVTGGGADGGDEGADPCGGRSGELCEIPALGPCADGVLRCEDGVLNCEALHTPIDELCNGIDDNCDGAIDEGEPEAAQPCDTAFTGVCLQGETVCVAGQLSCVQKNPKADSETCDGLDNDCDGQTDEDVPGQCALCEADVAVDAAVQGLCAAGVTICLQDAMRCVPLLPADWVPELGCDGLDTDCDGAVDETAEGPPPSPDRLVRARELCGAPAAGPEPLPPCPADPDTLTWSCDPGEGGGLCVPTQCADGHRVEDGRCVDDVERCNDGIDDDGDGLIDGTLVGQDPCTVTFDQGDAELRFGRCPSDDFRDGCQGSSFPGAPGGQHATCEEDDCPHNVSLTYPYALDREEVSVRAYLQCVEAGCCAPASGHIWKLARERLTQVDLGRRPEAHERCQQPPPLTLDHAPTAEVIFDLPVVGVSWCQARDYCNWAGKRLPTEYEWERAVTGPDNDTPRHWSWGRRLRARCTTQQCCRAEGFEWDPADPGQCDPTAIDLPVCIEEIPETTRRSCVATLADPPGACRRFDRERECPGCVFSPAPVWANEDGATPDGLLNMTGNVMEWVFDWFGDGHTPNSRVDPVGAGCDLTVTNGQRIAKGGGFLNEPPAASALRRQPGLLAGRLGYTGFRCSRTLPADDSVCDPQIPLVPARCGGEAQDPPPACGAPSFTEGVGGDLQGCEVGERSQTDHCLQGLVGLCGESPVSCSAHVVSHVRFVPAAIADHVPAAVLEALGDAIVDLLEEKTAHVNVIAQGVMAPAGGDTILVMDPPEDFDRTFQHPVRLGSAIIGRGGVLSWIGQEGRDGCEPAPRAEITIPRVAGSLDFVAECQRDDAALWLIEAPIRFRIAASRWEGEITADGASVSALGIMTLQDIHASVWGDPDQPADNFLLGVLEPFDLCPVAHMLGCAPRFEDCTDEGVDSTCTDPQTCTGILLPFELQTVRRELLDLPGMAPCE